MSKLDKCSYWVYSLVFTWTLHTSVLQYLQHFTVLGGFGFGFLTLFLPVLSGGNQLKSDFSHNCSAHGSLCFPASSYDSRLFLNLGYRDSISETWAGSASTEVSTCTHSPSGHLIMLKTCKFKCVHWILKTHKIWCF